MTQNAEIRVGSDADIEIRNTNIEIRNKFKFQNPNDRNSQRRLILLQFLSFGPFFICICFGFRISNLTRRISNLARKLSSRIDQSVNFIDLRALRHYDGLQENFPIMPLRDHFHLPLSRTSGYQEVHGQWPAVLVQQLGKLLPANYVAGPRIHLGTQIEVDVATFEQDSTLGASQVQNVGLATQVYAPPQPSLEVQTALGDFDEYEVRVYDVQRGRRLVAAIELISPGNKDRPETRGQFVAKCAALLRSGVCVVLVDIVTSMDFNLYSQLLSLIGERDCSLSEPPSATYAVTCRWHPRGTDYWLETWYQSLGPNQSLPVLPLWLTEDLAISLDLEASYEQSCRDLRIT